jgi:cyclic pyranopterin phosphate synthase
MEKSLSVRFIEMMPILNLTDIECNKNISTPDNPIIRAEDIFSIMGEFGKYRKEEKVNGFGPAGYYKIPGCKGNIGFILNDKINCRRCNRVRLTPRGSIRLCLFSPLEWDLKESMRRGCSDEEIKRNILDYIKVKPINREYEQDSNNGASRVSHYMSRIGG